jgi:hypothetical protein
MPELRKPNWLARPMTARNDPDHGSEFLQQ